MSAVGIDPGSSVFSIAHCETKNLVETLSRCGIAGARFTLPAAVLTTDFRAPVLEFQEPLTSHGTGGLWPPEAQVDAQFGARRLPLALALAALEVPITEARTSAHGGVNALQWSWPSFVQIHNRQVKTELVSALVRRTLQAYVESCKAPVALAVPNALPLMTQSALVSRAGFDARLIWRCMAAALGYMESAQPSARNSDTQLRITDGTPAIHVHLGFDGFETTAFTFRMSRGKNGPELLIPAKARVTTKNTASSPYLGLQIASFVLRRLGGLDSGELWEAMFGGSIASQLVRVEELRARRSLTVRESPTEDIRVGWKSVIGGAPHSEELLRSTLEKWVSRVDAVIDAQSDVKPQLAILTGDFANPDWVGAPPSSALKLSREMIIDLLERKSIKAIVPGHGVVARGAALFAARRARGWATYLDELPAVKIVVQESGEPKWETVLESDYYDAGEPVARTRAGFSLNAGAEYMKLPVYVNEFGEDTKDVLESQIDFERATSERANASVSIEIEAATGMPVVRATVHGEVAQTAEVDWSRDRVSLRTGKSMAEYLEGLPRAYPPTEELVAGEWWVKGGKFKLARIDGKEITADALCWDLVCLHRGGVIPGEAKVKELLRLARKREYHDGSKKWIVATRIDGSNPDSKCLHGAVEVLLGIALAGVGAGKLSVSAARTLAALRCRDPRWVKAVMAHCDGLADLGELHFAITGLGNCVYEKVQMGDAISALSRRLKLKVDLAMQGRAVPTGISTLRALGAQFALHPEALAMIDRQTAAQLADDVTNFIGQTLKAGGKPLTKFQAALRTLVFLTRRRAYQDDFLRAGDVAFNRAVRCCALVYVGAKLSTEHPIYHQRDLEKRITNAKEDLKHLRAPGQAEEGMANATTCAVIDQLDVPPAFIAAGNFPKSPTKLLRLLVQVIQYIEGRGTGILVIDKMDDSADDPDADD